MKKLTFLIFIFALAVLAFPVLAVQAPTLPMAFYGTATINGVSLPSDSVIKAYYGSASSDSGSLTTTAAGKYGAADPDNFRAQSDIPLIVSEGTGTIYFKAIISGYNGGNKITAAQTKTFTEGTTERLNLTFTTPATPAATPAAGAYTSSQSVVLTAAGSTAIYYTLDGTAPDRTKSPYSPTVSINSNKTLKAIAYDADGNGSQTLTAVYTFTCATVSNAASYNAYSTCGPATCNSGYTVSGLSCVSSGGGGGGGGGGGSGGTPIPSTKKGDANGDNKVDKYDFSLMMSNWGKTGTNICDFNNDGKVDKYDFALLMLNWNI